MHRPPRDRTNAPKVSGQTRSAGAIGAIFTLLQGQLGWRREDPTDALLRARTLQGTD